MDANRIRQIKASDLQFENREMRRLGELAVGVLNEALNICDDVTAKRIEAAISLIRKGHDLDFSTREGLESYRIPGAHQ